MTLYYILQPMSMIKIDHAEERRKGLKTYYEVVQHIMVILHIPILVVQTVYPLYVQCYVHHNNMKQKIAILT